MRFERVALSLARGARLAHTTRLPKRTLKKGRPLEDAELEWLREAGHASVVVAILESGDVDEDLAAASLAETVLGPGVEAARATTGRCNLYATVDGLFVVDVDRVNQLNAIDESLTVATLDSHSPVSARTMVATVKVIPFAVPEDRLAEAMKVGGSHGVSLRVAPWISRDVGVVLTELPGLPEKVMTRASSSLRTRIERLGSRVAREVRCPHEPEAVARTLRTLLDAACGPILMLGASAIVDRRDTLPTAVEAVGGRIVHLGMPVDPGNLLLLAEFDATPIIGVPGCARSTKPSGFDWVLERVLAGEPIGSREIAGMGVGGLLLETPSRPAPREGKRSEASASRPRIAAIVLAAGQSKRMGAVNKLLCEVEGAPMIARVVDAALASRAEPVVVVTGHENDAIRRALGARDVEIAHNPDFAAGMSTSLRVGLHALDEDVDAAIVCLGDMPWLDASHLNALVDAFDPDDDRGIYVPVYDRKRGNPVLWHRRFFEDMRALRGDQGARKLLDRHPDEVCYVPSSSDAINIDFDTPEALREARRPNAE